MEEALKKPELDGLKDELGEEFNEKVHGTKMILALLHAGLPVVLQLIRENSKLLTELTSLAYGLTADVNEGIAVEYGRARNAAAALNKLEFNALRKQGFTRSEALNLMLRNYADSKAKSKSILESVSKGVNSATAEKS